MGASVGHDRLLGHSSGPTGDEPTTTGAWRVVRVGLCVAVRNHADSLLFGRYGRCLRGISRGLLEREGFGVVPLTARIGFGRVEQRGE